MNTQTAPSGSSFLQQSNDHFAQNDLVTRLQWMDKHFEGQWVLSSSFGVQSAVLLHAVSQHFPTVPIIFIDTGYLFPETYRFAEELREKLQLNLHTYRANMTAAQQEALYGKRWEGSLKELEAYNFQNKVEPMNRALQELGATAWVSGLRHAQSKGRAERSFVEQQNKTVKAYPILDWSDRDIYQYLQKHDLPYHPLWHDGYVSIGDVHSTSKYEAGMNAEDTRFNGMKRECGLHEVSNQSDFQI